MCMARYGSLRAAGRACCSGCYAGGREHRGRQYAHAPMHQCTTPAAAAAAAAAACTSGAIWFNSYVSRSVLTYTTLLFLNVLITSGGEGRGAGGNASALGASAACTYHDSHWGAIMMVIVSKELETEAQGNQGVAFDNCKPSEK